MFRILVAAAALAVAAPTVVCAQTPAAASATSEPAATGGPAAVPTAGGDTSVAVAGGTPVKIAVTDQLASNTAHTGDRFQFRSLEDVTVDGWVIVPKGAIGEGEVVHAESAGGNGHPGKLQLQFDWIYSADNLKVKLSDVPSTNNGDAAKGAASTAAIASYLVLGPLGLFAHNFVHGKDVIVKPEQKIQVYVAQSVHVTPSQRVTSSDGFAH